VCLGTLPPGAACHSSSDCAAPPGGTADCDFPTVRNCTFQPDGGMSCDPGVCRAYARGAVGDPCAETCTTPCFEACSGPNRYCTDITGLATGAVPPPQVTARCFTNDGLYCAKDGTCQKQTGPGGACPPYRACGPTAYCSGTACVAVGQPGSPCQTGDQCAADAYCTTGKVCAAKKPAGSACTDWQECLSDSCGGLTQQCEGDSPNSITPSAAQCAAGSL
jgi:hypothetical protein